MALTGKLIEADSVDKLLHEELPLKYFYGRTLINAHKNCAIIRERISHLPAIDAVPVIRCKDCRYFCIKDHFGNINGVPILGASDVPTCERWANTESMVDENGYCFLAERREAANDGDL